MVSGDPSVPEAQAAPTKLPLKRRLLVWLIYGGVGLFGVLVVLAVIGHISEIGTLPECDSQRSRDAMSDVFSQEKVSLTKYNEIKTVASSKDEVTCQASLAIRGGGTLTANYTFYWEASKVKVRYRLTRS